MATNNNSNDANATDKIGQVSATRRLNAQELEHFQSMESWSGLSALLGCFGHTVDSLRIVAKTGALAYPLDVARALDAYKQGRLSAFSRLSCEFTGMLVVMRDLSETDLNGKYHRVVRVFPDDGAMLIDVTPRDWPPARVRYVKVSSAKVATMHYPQSQDGLNFRTCLAASNRDRAFASAGYDPLDVECLRVRPHPDVEQGRLWRDLPRLCEKLNFERAPGCPFKIEFGFQIFGKGEYSAVAEMFTANHSDKAKLYEYETAYSAEPCAILRDCRGNGIDVAPDIDCDPTQRAYHKLFVPDPAFNSQSWHNMLGAIAEYVDVGWMPTVPYHEELLQALMVCDARTFNPIDVGYDVGLGMIRGDLNRSWPDPNAKSIMCHPFSDSALTLPHPDRSEMHDSLVKMRRSSVLGGAVLLSRNLAVSIAEHHRDDHRTRGFVLNREELGTVCFGCYTRLTVAEAKLCGGCGKARYCSNACQKWHWLQHKACCASKQERDRRRESAVRNRAEREEHIRRHDEHEALLKAEVAAKEAQRKALAARTRAERGLQRANEVAERIRRATPQAPKPPKSKGRPKKVPTVEQQLLHAAWDSDNEREARTAAFVANQEAEHLEAVARKAQEKANALKKLAADASAASEAATHCVPCAPTVASVIDHRLRICD